MGSWTSSVEPTGLGGAEGVSTEDVGHLAGQGALEGEEEEEEERVAGYM